jgi:ABC-type hemin transport system substrate-binding protein
MAEKIEVGIKVVQVGAATKDIDSVDAKIKDLGSGFGLVQKAADKMTGGMASGMMAAYKSTKTFISGLKLTKAAMISTGIGALVVAVGALTVALATQGGELSAWNKATKGWKAGFKADINNVTVLGEAFGKLFTSGPAGS